MLFRWFQWHFRSFFCLGAAFTCGSGRLGAGCTGAKGIVGVTTLDLGSAFNFRWFQGEFRWRRGRSEPKSSGFSMDFHGFSWIFMVF